MGECTRIPWPRLRDYLLEVSSCRTLDESMRTACLEMSRVIPFDATTGIFRLSDNFNIAGIGKEGCTEAFNSYYRKLRPPVEGRIIDWRQYDCEYYEDFQLPNGMCKTLVCTTAGHATAIRVVRSRHAPDFCDDDADALALIEDYLNSLFASFAKPLFPLNSQFSFDGLADRFGELTDREAEVCSLIASRLTTFEIAARLFISPRTVERHVENIFEKLEVHSREQLRYRLGVLPYK